MQTRTATWSQLASALILTIGFALLWSALVVLAYSMVAQPWRTNGQVYESIQVAVDGTAVVASRPMTDYLDTTFRTLDGIPLPNQRKEWLTPASLAGQPVPPVLWETPVSWSARVAGLTDSQRPPVTWFVVRDNQPEGKAYLVGFDELSKLSIGYIGRRGFRRAMPPQDEWFDVGRHRFDWGRAIATTGTVMYGGSGISYGNPSALPPWLVFLIDGNRLLEIDLRARTLRSIHESPGLASVATVVEPRQLAARAAANETNTTNAAPAADDGAGNADNADNPKAVTRIALRTADKIIVLDPLSGAKREYALPIHVRDKMFQVYALGNEQLLLHWWVAETWQQQELVWLAVDGSVARQERVMLSAFQGPSEREAALLGALAMPIPIGYVLGVLLGMPAMLLQSNQAATYLEAVARALDVGWLGLIATPLVGAVLAWWTYRLQRKYHRPATGLWCVFVLLLGLPAFLAYWIEHRRPKLQSCGECGTIVPRDREACAACNTGFSPPPRLGTEIYA